MSLFFPLTSDLPYSLQAVTSKIAHATDTWTLPGMMFAFAGTIATWIDDDWNLIERVIGFSQVDCHEHTGSGSASKMSTFRP